MHCSCGLQIGDRWWACSLNFRIRHPLNPSIIVHVTASCIDHACNGAPACVYHAWDPATHVNSGKLKSEAELMQGRCRSVVVCLTQSVLDITGLLAI